MNRKHLTPDEIAEWFSGERRRDVLDHINNCAACHTEVLCFEISLGEFRRSVRDWSGEQFALSSSRMHSWSRRPWRQPLWLSAALALLLAISGVAFYSKATKAAAVTATFATSDAILLEQVDQQTSRTVPSAMAPLARLVSWDGKQ